MTDKQKSHKRRGAKRADIVHRRIHALPSDDPAAVSAAFSAKYSPSGAMNSVLSWFDAAERNAFACLAKHGLPALPGPLMRIGTGDWQPAHQPPSDAQLSWAFAIANKAAEPDSEVGFAAAVLEEVHKFRAALQANRLDPWQAADRAFDAAQLLHDLELEFRFKGLGGALRQGEGRRRGGRDRAAAIRAAKEHEWENWQAIADSLWGADPGLPATHVASVIKKRLRTMSTVRTIRGRIVNRSKNLAGS